MSEELKLMRCGCGGEAIIETDHDTVVPGEPIDWKRVVCRNCNIRTTWRHTESEAVQAWNRAMGTENICKNCKAYFVMGDCGYCKYDDEYPTADGYGCNCFSRRES